MGDITQLLEAARGGHRPAMDAVFSQLYPELRALANARLREQPGALTLNATALLHEAYLKLVDADRLELVDRHHFFACAARAMRHILVDKARARGAVKRGGNLEPATLSNIEGIAGPEPGLLDIDAALERLDSIDPMLRELVEMRIFAGMTLEQLAETSGRSLRTINRDWQRARALLVAQLG